MKVDVKKAYEIAREEIQKKGSYKIVEIVDIGDCYAFCYEPSDGEDPIPGDCPITVNKDSGEVGIIAIPPIANLDKLEAGQKIPIPAKDSF